MRTLRYQKSTYSGASCVQLASAPGGLVAIGDSKLDGGNDQNPILTTAINYSLFFSGIIAGDFDLNVLSFTPRRSQFSITNCLWVWLTGPGMVALYEDEYPGVVKYYAFDEWDCFLLGVKAGELVPALVAVTA